MNFVAMHCNSQAREIIFPMNANYKNKQKPFDLIQKLRKNTIRKHNLRLERASQDTCDHKRQLVTEEARAC